MIVYQSLTQDQSVQLAHQRVADLEAEHFRMRLLLAEAVNPADIESIELTIADLERRHAIHTTPPAEQGHGHGHGHGHDENDKNDGPPADEVPGTVEFAPAAPADEPVTTNGARPE